MRSSVVNCAIYGKDNLRHEISVDNISDALCQENAFVWLGLFEPDSQLMRKVQEEFDLHDLAVEDAEKAHQQPKIEEYGDVLFVVLHTALLVDNHIALGETHVFVGPKFVVTVRHRDSDGYASVRKKSSVPPKVLRMDRAMCFTC